MPFVAPWWLMSLFNSGLRWLIQRPEPIVGPHIAPGATVLDVGCGPGYFSLPMAAMVGPGGTVIGVDLQQRSLDIVRLRAARLHVDERIRTVLCQRNDIGVREPVDFALAFYMVHETPDAEATLRQIAECLKPQGALLLVEPIFHVRRSAFEATVRTAEGIGLEVVARPRIRFSRAVLLARADRNNMGG
ncbi:MAG: class I SAM-dependent methyltransferase [Planctomycetes bacterium]|nr:class I SAM-dependent methyltransferase [Planctomycetota bacterium]